MIISSKRHKDWHSIAVVELSSAVRRLKMPRTATLPLETTTCTTLTFYAPNKRKYDLSNRAESIMDLLVDCGIIQDDNWSVIPQLTVIHGGIDTKDPRCEIIINI